MKKIILTGKYYRKILEMQEKDLIRNKKKFLKKKRTHLNNKQLAEFYSGLYVKFSEKVYEIKFKCFFTLYLYLYLKSQAKSYYEDDPSRVFNLSKPIDFNIQHIVDKSGVARNTVKRAFKELLQLRFINECEYVKPTHNSTKTVSIVNDHFMLCYVEKSHQVMFTIDPWKKG